MTVGSLAAGLTPASATINDTPGYVHIANVGSGKCIDVGPPVEQWRCLNTFNEEWQFVYAGNGYYEIVSHASGLCLAQADSSDNGTPVVQEPCAQVASQRWQVVRGIGVPYEYYYKVINESFNQCLDLENGITSDGVPMQVWDCAATNNQWWYSV